MSLKAGAKRSAARPPFCFVLGEEKTASGKVGNLLLVFHFSAPRRSCGNVGIAAFAISKDCGRPWETCLWFSSASTGRHFHSRSASCALLLPNSGQHPLFGLLHVPRCFRIAFCSRHSF